MSLQPLARSLLAAAVVATALIAAARALNEGAAAPVAAGSHAH